MKNSKKLLFLLLVICLFPRTLSAQENDGYQKPALEHPDSWSMIMIPDPQNYAKYGRNQPILDLMMAWIEENIDTLHIRMVVCTGDLVEQNDRINRGDDGDQSAQRQWEFIARSFSKLDGKVPYIAATGNHDYSIDMQGNRTSRFQEFFTIDKNWMNRKTIVQNNYNEEGFPTLDNSAYEIKSLHGKDYLFLTMEFAPRDTIVSWARTIAELEQYKNHRIVLLTHAFLNNKDERTNGVIKWFRYNPISINNYITKSEMVPLPYSNNGEQIWEKLIYPVSNIEMVLCGHISGEGYRQDTNSTGKSVHQMLFDAQSMGGGHRNGNGGDGWLRILEFFPDGKKVTVKTFSPLFGISPTTREHAWKRDNRNEYTFFFN